MLTRPPPPRQGDKVCPSTALGWAGRAVWALTGAAGLSLTDLAAAVVAVPSAVLSGCVYTCFTPDLHRAVADGPGRRRGRGAVGRALGVRLRLGYA